MAIQITRQTDAQQNRLSFVHSLLKGKIQKCDGYFKAHCPAHKDQSPSLSIWEDPEDGHCVLNCFAHCERSAICSALGIEEKDLYYNDENKRNLPATPRLTVAGLASAKGLDPAFLEEIGVTGGHELTWEKGPQYGGVTITYRRLDGSIYERCHVRQEFSSRNSPWYPPKDSEHPPIPYGLDRLHSRVENDTLFIVEGESDCWTLWYHGFHAIGLPGAGMTDKLEKEHIALFPKQVTILQDPNIAGEKFSFLVKTKLRARGYTGEISMVRLPWGDANDLNKKLFREDKLSDFREMFQNAVKIVPETTEEIKHETSTELSAKPVSVKALIDFMENMQYGDGQLFRACFKDQVVYDPIEHEWYLWKGHHWGRDVTGKLRVLISGHMGAVYMNACAELVKERADKEQELHLIQPEKGELTDTQEVRVDELKKRIAKIDSVIKQFQHRAKELRTDRYRGGVERYAEESVSVPITEDETSVWDRKRALLGVKNGVVDLTTGAFRSGTPGDYIRTVCPTEWGGLDAQCPMFEQYLQDLFELREDREETVRFLQRLIGYALTGTCKEAIFVILYGPEGRNGKTTLFNILLSAIGKALAGGVRKELLLDTGKSAQPNSCEPDTLALQGKRFAIAAETKKGDKLNISAIKNLTGKDEIRGRGIHAKHETRFAPTFTLFLHTNYKPHADSLDTAFWARACLIEFGMRFIDNPDPSKPNERKDDKELVDKIIATELPGILAWVVRGALEYKDKGLARPESVKLAGENYRTEEDTLLSFISECCVISPDCKVSASSLYDAYKIWSGDGYRLNSKEFPKQMELKYKRSRTKASVVYLGIGLLSDTAMSETITCPVCNGVIVGTPEYDALGQPICTVCTDRTNMNF